MKLIHFLQPDISPEKSVDALKSGNLFDSRPKDRNGKETFGAIKGLKWMLPVSEDVLMLVLHKDGLKASLAPAQSTVRRRHASLVEFTATRGSNCSLLQMED